MYKHILIVVFTFLVGTQLLVAQSSTGSLYSAFGVGEIDQNGSGKTKLLAGTGIGLISDGYLNNTNPASFGSLNNLRFIFEAGFEGSQSTYSTYDLRQKHSTVNFNYLAMGFQISNWWKSSIGLRPFSHTGYNVTTSKYIEGTAITYDTYFTGDGDLSQIYWASAFVPFKNLSLGVNVSYLFGNKKEEEKVIVPITLGEETLTRTRYIKSLYTDFGLQYTINGSKFDYSIGAIYGPGKDLNSSTTLTYVDSTDSTRTESGDESAKLSLPEKAGAGFSIRTKDNNFSLALDYKWEDWEAIKLNNVEGVLKNSQRYSMGLEYVPFKSMNDPYLRRIRYMFGSYYTDTNIEYKGIAIKEKGLTLGFGLPLRDNRSSLNLGFEMGQKGTKQQGLTKENFFKVHVSFSLSDTWFQKPKFQ